MEETQVYLKRYRETGLGLGTYVAGNTSLKEYLVYYGSGYPER